MLRSLNPGVKLLALIVASLVLSSPRRRSS